jgi:phospholipase C
MGDARTAGTTRGSRLLRKRYILTAAAALTAALTVSTVSLASANSKQPEHVLVPKGVPASLYLHARTATPVKHVVVLFDENESFDHYFGTYPYAANADGPAFHAKPGTPTVNGLYTKITKNGPAGPLLTSNPNEYNPQRLTHSQALTCDENHSYFPEQEAVDNGSDDKYVQFTGSSSTCNVNAPAEFASPGLVMDYFDGNTVTALWNYAQNYSMSDNNYDTNYGPSTPGALNLVSGDDSAAYAAAPGPTTVVPPVSSEVTSPGHIGTYGADGLAATYGDIDPYFDDCSDTNHTATSALGIMTGQNIGDLLNEQHVTWGWFQGGFAPTTSAADSSTGFAQCGATHQNIGGATVADYSPHHNPFEYYASTANPHHLPPSSERAIGRTDQANHQYDLSLFDETLKAGNMPAVSFLKAAEYQDGHPGYSDPLDEQNFIVTTVNEIEQSRYWDSTAIIIAYDDSDGWYDHVTPPVVSGSNDPANDTAICSAVSINVGTENDRCGYGIRQPLVVISPFTRTNYVSSNQTDTSSITKFIEDNWLHGESTGPSSFTHIAGSLDARGGVLDFNGRPNDNRLILDPATGEVVRR